MKSLLALIVAASIVMAPARSLAASGSTDGALTNVTQVTAKLHPKKLYVEGVEGVWHEKREMYLILEKLELLKDTEAHVVNLEVEVTGLKTTLAKADETIATVKQQSAQNADLAKKFAQDVDDASVWYKSPILWLGVGLLAGAAIVLLSRSDSAAPVTIVQPR